MRTLSLAVAVGVLAGGSAVAGTPGLGNVSPNLSRMTNKPVVVPSSTLALPSVGGAGLTLSNFFRRFTSFGSTPTLGHSALPAPGSLPGSNYKSRFHPLPPTTAGALNAPRDPNNGGLLNVVGK